MTENDLEALQMSEQTAVHITIFQAPFASLIEQGLYRRMYDSMNSFCGPVPAEYYLVAFDGEIDCPPQLPEDGDQRIYAILEHIFYIFNRAYPAGYCGRSLSVGDVVQMGGKHYICATKGFHPITFEASKGPPMLNPTACPLPLPDGTGLQVSVYMGTKNRYPCININHIAPDGSENPICFAEYDYGKEPGHELCVGAYCASRDETVYYSSYVQEYSQSEH